MASGRPRPTLQMTIDEYYGPDLMLTKHMVLLSLFTYLCWTPPTRAMQIDVGLLLVPPDKRLFLDGVEIL